MSYFGQFLAETRAEVARAISAMVNSNNADNGVLAVKLNGKYEDGKYP